MSDEASHPGEPHAHAHGADDAHDDGHAHEPPPPPEPQTPMWLPALGAALFVTVALWWAVTPKTPVVAPDAGDTTGAASASAAPAQPQAAPNPGAAASAAAIRTLDGGMDNAALQRLLDRLPK